MESATKLSFYQRFAKPILWATLLLIPIVLFGGVRVSKTAKNRVIDWLPANFEETERLLWFTSTFGSDEILAISWDTCTLENGEVDELVTALKQPFQFGGNAEARPIFHKVISGRSVLDKMTSEGMGLNESQALDRLSGWLVGPDKQTTCVIARITPNPDGSFSRDEAVAFVRETATSMSEQLGIQDDLQIAGPTADSAAINRAGAENINLMRMAAVAFGLGLAWIALRDRTQVFNVFATAVFATLLSLASVYFCGQYMDAILLPLPALVFVLTVSGAIHLTHYYNESKTVDDAAGYAIRVGGLPCALAAGTTMIGLASLAVSNVLPVKRFGLLSAMGVGLGLICLLLLWPAIAQRFGGQARKHTDSNIATGWWQPLFQLTTKFCVPIVVFALVALPCLVVGFGRISTSVKLSSLLPSGSHLMQSYDWFNERLGPLVPVEMVLCFPESTDDDAKTMFKRAQWVESLRTEIENLDASGGTFAATTFAPALPEDTGARQITQRLILGKRLLSHRDDLIERRLICNRDGTEYWRISTRVSSRMGDYSPFLNSVNETVDTFLVQPQIQEAGVTARVCGSIPLIQKAQQELLRDLIRSLLFAIGLITLAMALLLRNPLAGIVSMIPNVFPSLLVLGVMGFQEKLVDIGTMMTASVALGIAVDDTLHFLVWFRRAAEQGANRIEAVRHAFEKCAGAMFQTTIICGFGMLPFMYSSFGPVSRFAGGMIALLSAALIGDLVILPAILASPLGRLFANAPAGHDATSSQKTTPATQFRPT